MTILLVVVALVVITAVSLFMVGDRGRMPDEAPDREPSDLPTDRLIITADIDRVRFATAFRGYRMDQVDVVLDRFVADLDARTAYVSTLQAALAAAGADVPEPPVPASGADDVTRDDAVVAADTSDNHGAGSQPGNPDFGAPDASGTGQEFSGEASGAPHETSR